MSLFFSKEDRDYTKGQAIYTLLKKEKINTDTGTVQIQYDGSLQKIKIDPAQTATEQLVSHSVVFLCKKCC